ncbi:MAG TPA: hypothetical protein VF759_07585 [Allosphingosinicella sp.]|jgi:hypothetical protein
MNLDRKLGLAAVASVLLAGAAGAALAHPHPDGDGDGKKGERVIIMRDGHGEHHGKGKGDRVRRFKIVREGGEPHARGPGERIRHFELHGGRLVGCEGGEKIVDETGGSDDRKTKVVICTKGAPSAATADRLEKALARINSNDELSDEQKARIETALRSAIDRARSAR